MPRYRLTIAYDGTEFHGWQKQEPPDPDAPPRPEAEADADRPRIQMRTVQGVVERAVREVVREPVILLGASRTDAGVHAKGQVAAFTCSDLPRPHDVEAGFAGEPRSIRTGWPADRGTLPLLRAINSRLPGDILVTAADLAPPNFDPIGHATRKCYSYTFHVSPHRALWDRHRVHHLWTPHDANAMALAAPHFVGTHDFGGFAAAGHGRLTTVRTVFACRVERQACPDALDPSAHRIRMEIEGSGFLYNMVRIIAGTLADVGRGRLAPGDIPAIITSVDRRRAGPTLPPSGLCLEWIEYGGLGR